MSLLLKLALGAAGALAALAAPLAVRAETAVETNSPKILDRSVSESAGRKSQFVGLCPTAAHQARDG